MITKLDISNFGLYKNYSWQLSVGRDETFRKLNIIYGRNYSGKTTLSRILKCIEDKKLHNNYTDGMFSISLTGGDALTHNNFETSFNLRVYNTDFVHENLSWLHNEEGSIKPFTILGAKNIELEKQLVSIVHSLGSVEEERGKLFELESMTKNHDQARKALNLKKIDLDNKLKGRANDKIKVNPNFFVATKSKKTYSIIDIKVEIDFIKNDIEAYSLSESDVNGLIRTLKDIPLESIDLLKEVKPNFPNYYEEVKYLVQQPIKPSVGIKDLLEDHILQEWVRQGIDKHRGKRENCAFCGGTIPVDLWIKLDEHFSKESEELRSTISLKIDELQKARTKLEGFVCIKRDDFYSSIQSQFDKIFQNWLQVVDKYKSSLERLILYLESRIESIFKPITVTEIKDFSEDILQAIQDFNNLIDENNIKSASLEVDQKEARDKLRASDIAQYLADIEYHKLEEEIENLGQHCVEIEQSIAPLKYEVDSLLNEKQSLEAQAKDESKGAELVNSHLSHFFGHKELRLISVDQEIGVRFKIQRDGADAKNLSEGEASLISFCYFIARIEDELKDEFKHNKLIIYIDDPMSSLDSNHIFFMYSLIEAVIAKPRKYAQLFISTHNLEFLKYLRKLTIPKYNPGLGKGKTDDVRYFLIERKNSESTCLRLAPPYLSKYVTEFNYLFEQIYSCSTLPDQLISDDYQYNFSNNMRKFLEAYLFYKYPSHLLTNDQRIRKYFDDDTTSVTLINRVTNEYSHLEDKFDRSLQPIDLGEIRQISELVLKKIKTDDPNQYEALLESIGKSDPYAEVTEAALE